MNDLSKTSLDYLEACGVISTADKNLRTKVDSLLRSLENLQAKKDRLDYEIKKQKRALVRKRQELKRVSQSSSRKVGPVLESAEAEESTTLLIEITGLKRLDSRLLQESSQVLDD